MNNKPIDPDEAAMLSDILQGSRFKAVSKISYGSYGEIFKISDSQKEYALKVINKERLAK
jgi:hypothetical protein